MKSFADNAGRTWTVAIHVAAVKRVRALLNVDLYKVADDGFQSLADLIDDPVQLVDVLYVLCRDEATQRGVTDEDFGRALGGDAIGLAAEALVEELIDFFPEARARASLRKVVAASRQVRDRVLDHAQQLANQIDPEQAARTLIGSFGNWPASSASIPTR